MRCFANNAEKSKQNRWFCVFENVNLVRCYTSPVNAPNGQATGTHRASDGHPEGLGAFLGLRPWRCPRDARERGFGGKGLQGISPN